MHDSNNLTAIEPQSSESCDYNLGTMLWRVGKYSKPVLYDFVNAILCIERELPTRCCMM